MSEFTEQCAVIGWARLSQGQHPELRWLHSSLNGVKLTPGLARKMKMAGMTRGIPDLFLPVKRGSFPGLYVELKTGKNRVTEEQREFIEFARTQGYCARVCYGADEAIRAIQEYLTIAA